MSLSSWHPFTSANPDDLPLLERLVREQDAVLENALIENRFWLPRRQEIEIRRTGSWLDYPARGIIRGRWEIEGYDLNVPLPDVPFDERHFVILKTLALEPMHGYGIASWIEGATGDVLRVEEGSLYPALYRMTRKRWIKGEWGTSENNRRAKYYKLTAHGRKAMKADPALASTVFITTCTDVVGYASYLGFATVFARMLITQG